MTPTLLVLLGCSFVEPPQPPVELDPAQEVLDRIDARRERLQGTDAGAELWRSIDAHGGLLRYERVGPWTAHLADGRVIPPGDPVHDALSAPFSWVDSPMADAPPGRGDTVVVRTAEGRRIDLDPVDRSLRSWSDDLGIREVVATRTVQGVELITELVLPDGAHVVVQRWEPADPLPGWPLDEG